MNGQDLDDEIREMRTRPVWIKGKTKAKGHK